MRSLLFVWLLGAALISGNLPTLAEPPAPAEPPPAPLPAVDFHHLPWGDGESLTYLVCLGSFEAAQGTFTALKKSDHWEFKLAMVSRGLVQDTYPFTSSFWSILGPAPWRSVEYGEYRFEPSRTIKERTRIDYAQHQGTRENWVKNETKVFTITADSVDDIGSLLYHIRALDWKPGDKRTFFVYESNSEKQSEVECLGRETHAYGTWPAQPLLRIRAVPTKGTRRKGSLTIWITDDTRHLPVHAELSFVYGSFSLDLTKADKTLPVPK